MTKWDIHTRPTRKRKITASTPCAGCGNELRADQTVRGKKDSGLFYCGSRCRDSLIDALAHVEETGNLL
jgi:hypothetical protein